LSETMGNKTWESRASFLPGEYPNPNTKTNK
jgi:hypothetical protein